MEYKTIKIPTGAYTEAKHLSEELEENKAIAGVHSVTLSLAISYAISRTREMLKRRVAFLSAAGGWKDMKDIDKLTKEIYRDRTVNLRKEVSL